MNLNIASKCNNKSIQNTDCNNYISSTNCLLTKNDKTKSTNINRRLINNNFLILNNQNQNKHHLNCYKLIIKFMFILSLFTSTQFLVQNVEAKKLQLKGRNLEYFCR